MDQQKIRLKKINDSKLGTGQFTDTDITKNGKGKHVRGYTELQRAIYAKRHPKVEQYD